MYIQLHALSTRLDRIAGKTGSETLKESRGLCEWYMGILDTMLRSKYTVDAETSRLLGRAIESYAKKVQDMDLMTPFTDLLRKLCFEQNVTSCLDTQIRQNSGSLLPITRLELNPIILSLSLNVQGGGDPRLIEACLQVLH